MKSVVLALVVGLMCVSSVEATGVVSRRVSVNVQVNRQVNCNVRAMRAVRLEALRTSRLQSRLDARLIRQQIIHAQPQVIEVVPQVIEVQPQVIEVIPQIIEIQPQVIQRRSSFNFRLQNQSSRSQGCVRGGCNFW